MADKKRKQQSFEYGALILICSTALVKIIGAVFKIPLDRLIGDLGFGYFSSAYDLFTPIYTLAMAGLPIAISRVVAEHMAAERYNDVKGALSVTRKLFLVSGFVGFALMLALIYPFVRLTDATGKTVYSLFAIAPALLSCCIMSTYRGYYEGLRNMYPTAISDVTEAMGKLVLGYSFAFAVMRITGDVALAAAGAMLGITVGSVAAALYLKLRYKIKGDAITEEELLNAPERMPSRNQAKAIILIAIPVVLASLANSVASLVDVSMVKWQLTNLVEDNASIIRQMYSSSIADYNLSSESGVLSNAQIPTFLYGIRGKAFTLYNLIPTITSVLGVSALPVISSAWSLKEKSAVKRNIESTIKLTALISIPAGMGFLFLGGRIMGLIYATVASEQIGGSMMQIYGVAAIFAGLAIPMTSMLQGIGKQVASLRNVAIGAALKVVVNFIAVGIPTVNIKGAAIGTAVCYIYIFLAHLCTIIRATGIKPNLYKSILKPFVAALCCGLSAFGVSNLIDGKKGTIISIVAAAVVYFVALVVINAFEDEDILALPKGEKLLKIFKKLKIIR